MNKINIMQTKNPVVWFEIQLDDLIKAQSFDENILNILDQVPTPDGLEEMDIMAFPMEMDGPGTGGA